MAKASIIDAHQALLYIILTLLPFFLAWFGTLFKAAIAQLLQLSVWYHFRLPVRHFPIKHHKKKLSAGLFLLAHRVPSHKVCPARSLMVLTYLPPLAFLCYKVACRVERFFHGLRCMFQRPDILQRIPYQSERGQSKLLPTMCFDTNSFTIGIDSFASVTMGTQPDQFEDLILDTGQSVQGIQGGLSIKGHGTFKFSIEDNEGMVHMIKIPNSM
jgi:hypothetical protein